MGVFILLKHSLQQEIEVRQASVKLSLPLFFLFFIIHPLPLCIELHLLLVFSQRGDIYDAEILITESSHSLLEPHAVLSQGAASTIRMDWDNGGPSERQPRPTTVEKAILQTNLLMWFVNLAH